MKVHHNIIGEAWMFCLDCGGRLYKFDGDNDNAIKCPTPNECDITSKPKQKPKENMIIQGEDGINHINVYSKGKTKIGRWLSNFAHSPFTIPEGDTFQSVEGYWYWLMIKGHPEELKYLHGFKAKQIGRELKELHGIEITSDDEGFQECIKNALDCKLRANRGMCKLLANTNLPLCHYYVYGDKRIDAGYEWIIQHIDKRRKQLKEHYKSQ